MFTRRVYCRVFVLSQNTQRGAGEASSALIPTIMDARIHLLLSSPSRPFLTYSVLRSAMTSRPEGLKRLIVMHQHGG